MISILGCGWYGLALGRALVNSGVIVKGSTTSNERLDELLAAGLLPYIVKLNNDSVQHEADFFDCETLIVSIPPKLRSGETDYLLKIRLLIPYLIKYEVKQVIYISSTGVYPDCNKIVDERTLPKPDTESGKVLRAVEELLMEQSSFQTTIIRFGGLVGPDRHAGRFFAGKQDIPNGKAPVNVVHLKDCIGLTVSILNNNAHGHVFNACSPEHPTKVEFYTQAAIHADLPEPGFISELKNWKIVSSINIPNILSYKFSISIWQQYFEDNDFLN